MYKPKHGTYACDNCGDSTCQAVKNGDSQFKDTRFKGCWVDKQTKNKTDVFHMLVQNAMCLTATVLIVIFAPGHWKWFAVLPMLIALKPKNYENKDGV